jgi:hypothetical protein
MTIATTGDTLGKLNQHIKRAVTSTDLLAALEAWIKMIRSNGIHYLKETALHWKFAAKIIKSFLDRHKPEGETGYILFT